MKDFIPTPDDYADDAYLDETTIANDDSQRERANTNEIFYKELPQSRQQSDTVFCKVNLGSINDRLAKSLAKQQGPGIMPGAPHKKSLDRSTTFKMKQLDRERDDDC